VPSMKTRGKINFCDGSDEAASDKNITTLISFKRHSMENGALITVRSNELATKAILSKINGELRYDL